MKLARTFIAFLKVFFLVLILVSCNVFNKKDIAKKTSDFKFEISFTSQAHPEDITGRVYVMISRNDDREPRFQVRAARSVPIWGKDVFHIKPEELTIIDEDEYGYPLKSIREIPPGEYYVQGFVNVYTEFKRSDGHILWMHNDQWEGQQWNISPGNIYSDVKKVNIDPSKKETIKISCNNIIPPIEVPADTEWVKRIKIQSKILTEFWGVPMYLGAKILLPKGYDIHPDVYYPVEYIQDHFNHEAPHTFRSTDPGEGNQHEKYGYESYKLWTSNERQPRMISVRVQHPCPYYDDSYGVNSANVGPYGDAFMEELIPYVEEHFRIIREPWARVTEGGSTGGWTSLAQQIIYPDFYGGVFCLCPDPIDFREFFNINIYEDDNAYYDENEWGVRTPKPATRTTLGEITATNEQIYTQELVLGTKSRSGGQWDIYDALYGPVGEDGYPKPICDRISGKIDHTVAEYWRERYDLRYILERDWKTIGPKLKGKIHIYCGDMDTYALNNAVYLMENFLARTDPSYGGIITYGDRQPHCWGPWGAGLIKLVGEHFLENAPSGERKKWVY